ncbi:hypothetical protein [Azospirillum brasilense]|uniref:Uncharacterized protein n=1 Tax=Azospirillum brasilense TaxID=192 RepID=A0A235H4M9_AZOBR|nr:hypothetical protein [Azospirillum brasilense]OYD80417.1 hypothetical protein CHT98_31410 [Azospirillum brasilense]
MGRAKREVPKAAVKKAYVEGILLPDGGLVYPTMIQLAEQFGVARETVSRWINREHWETDRAFHQQRMQEATDAEKARQLSKAPGLDQRTAELAEELKEHGVEVRPAPAAPAEPAPERGASMPEPEEEALQPAATEPPPGEPAAAQQPGATPDFRTHVIVGERAKFDTTSVTIAKALQAEVAVTIQRSRKPAAGKKEAQPLAPKELLSLAGTLERAQRIGRLALGQTTDNQGLSSPDGTPVKVNAEMSVDVRNSGYDKLPPSELARLYAEAISACPEDGVGQEAPGAHKGAPRP